MLLSFLNAANASDRSQESLDREFYRCMESIKCPEDGKSLSELEKTLSKDQFDEVRICRLERFLTCLPKREE